MGFGGKSRIASAIWDRLGPVDNYVEPFAGSLAGLLERPDDRWQTGAETVNDKDAYLSNFWRALASDPERVAHWADWPVNETDLVARHSWLVNSGRERLARLESDPDFFDAKVAGWWVWGINSWIGSGWCSGRGPWHSIDGKMVDVRQLTHLGDAGQGINRQRPHLGSGQGVNRQLPHLGDAGQRVNRQLPHLGNAGRGVNRKLPHLGNAGFGINRQRPTLDDHDPGERFEQRTCPGSLVDYFFALANRLRRVRVCCGDWSRVVTNGALTFGDTIGILLDPPYSGEIRKKSLYSQDDYDIAESVRQWAMTNGNNPRYRIALCGYESEHASFMPRDWEMMAWKANTCYGNSRGELKNESNRRNERIWFSPNCLKPEKQISLL